MRVAIVLLVTGLLVAVVGAAFIGWPALLLVLGLAVAALGAFGVDISL